MSRPQGAGSDPAATGAAPPPGCGPGPVRTAGLSFWLRCRTTDVLLWSAVALLVLRQVLVSAAGFDDLHPLVLTVLFGAVACLLLQRVGTWQRHRRTQQTQPGDVEVGP